MRRILLAAPVSIDLLNFEREAFIDEILNRTRLLFASYDPALGRFGIVDKDDPKTALSGDTSRSFVVSVNATDSTAIDVSGGTAVFSTGEVLVLDTGVERRSVPGGIGTTSVVYLEFSELETATRLTRWDTPANTMVDFLASSADYIKVDLKSTYDALTIAEKDLTIPLAVVSVQEVVTGVGTASTLVVDHTTTQLSVNRPWFSPVDIEHRSYHGSGVASTSNPHAISLNDVSASSTQTLFQIQLDHGMIVSKDKSLAKVPGKLCVETILEAAITEDTTGSVTGIVGGYWFATSNFPTLVIRATDTSTGFDYAPLQIKRTNKVFLLPSDQYVSGTDIEVTYLTTDAAEPSTATPITSLSFKQVGDRETVISEGLVVNSITADTLSFSDAGPVPQRFIVYMNSSGEFKRYPQTCASYVKLSSIGTTPQSFTQDLLGAAPLKLALQGAVPSPTLTVTVQVSGLDQNGSTISEDVTFTDATWTDNAAGTCTEEPQQFAYTINTFTSVFNYIVTTNIDSGPAASLAIYGDITPELTPELADILPVVDILWDGLQVCELEDIRPINTQMSLPRVTKYSGSSVASAEGTLVYTAGSLFNHWVEDFDQPKFITNKWSDDAADTLAGSVAFPPFDTKMRKIFDGLDLRDVYVSKPIAVRPHLDAPVALRFIPIEPGRDFKLYARYFDGTALWSPWLDSGSMFMPPYKVSLTGAVTPLVKWQMAVSGQCKGMIIVYVVDSVPGAGGGLPPEFAWDVGVWDDGAFS